MKRTGSHRTLRGTLEIAAGGQGKRDLILDDGRINIG